MIITIAVVLVAKKNQPQGIYLDVQFGIHYS